MGFIGIELERLVFTEAAGFYAEAVMKFSKVWSCCDISLGIQVVIEFLHHSRLSTLYLAERGSVNDNSTVKVCKCA